MQHSTTTSTTTIVDTIWTIRRNGSTKPVCGIIRRTKMWVLTEILRFKTSRWCKHRSRIIKACRSKVDTTPRRKMPASNPLDSLDGLTGNSSICIPSTVMMNSSILRWTEMITITLRGTLLLASTPRMRVAKVIRHRLLHSSKNVICSRPSLRFTFHQE